MTMTETKTDVRLMTADELLRLYSKGVRGELIRGELYKTMPAGIERTWRNRNETRGRVDSFRQG